MLKPRYTLPYLLRSFQPRRLGALGAVALGMLCFAPSVGAQLVNPLVPGGSVRLHFAPSFTSWDSRFGLRQDGSTSVDAAESLALDLTAADGVDLFPGVGLLRESLAALTGQPGYDPTLGPAAGNLVQEVTRMDMGLHVGVFDWLTVGASVPLVKNRTVLDAYLQGSAEGADLGLNPNLDAPGGVNALLAGLQRASIAAQALAESVCGSGDAAACESAQALSARATDFWTRTESAYLATPFFPLAGSAVGDALVAALASLDADLTGAGLLPVGATMSLATSTVSSDDFASLPAGAAFGGTPLRSLDGLWGLGDVEVSATARLLSGEVRDSGAVRPRLRFLLTGGVLVRLGTGQVDDPDVFLDLGSGDGQTDVEGQVDGMLEISRWGVRGGLRYGVQSATSLLRRVAPWEQVITTPGTLRAVRWTPGSYVAMEVAPRFRVSEGLWLEAGYRRYSKSEDTYQILGEEPPGITPVDIGDLMRETEVSLQELSFGVRYNTVAAWQDGRIGTPMEFGARLRQAVLGSGGQTPKTTRLEVSINVYRRLWGAPPG